MQNITKSIENNALAALSQRAPQNVVQAIKTASDKTGVSFSYLMHKAAAESSFNPTVKAKTSSATGLFQFIESTWMDMVAKHGAKHGIDANQSRSELMNLRKDPALASIMAAEFASDNKKYLQQTVGGKIGETELYFAHFMGAKGASAFLSQLKHNPDSRAADIFPKEARANRNVFYDPQTGHERSLQQVYDFFDKKFSSSNPSSEKVIDTPLRKKSGYQHIPFSMKQPVEILPLHTSRSILSHQSAEMSSFFSRRTSDTNSVFPIDMYSKLTNPTAMLLSILK